MRVHFDVTKVVIIRAPSIMISLDDIADAISKNAIIINNASRLSISRYSIIYSINYHYL